MSLYPCLGASLKLLMPAQERSISFQPPLQQSPFAQQCIMDDLYCHFAARRVVTRHKQTGIHQSSYQLIHVFPFVFIAVERLQRPPSTSIGKVFVVLAQGDQVAKNAGYQMLSALIFQASEGLIGPLSQPTCHPTGFLVCFKGYYSIFPPFAK